MKYSQSILKAYRCPRRGHALALDLEKHGKRRGTGYALLGQAVHEFIADYMRHLSNTNQLTDSVSGYMIARGTAEGYNLGSLIDEFVRIVDRFIECEGLPNGSLFTIELPVEFCNMVGTPDLVEIDHGNDIIRIHDWKTDRRIRTQSEVQNDYQMKFYADLMRGREYSNYNFEGVLHFVRYGEQVSGFWTVEDIENFHAEVQADIARIEAMTEYPAIGGEVCDFCDIIFDCPEIDDDDQSIIRDQADAHMMASRLCVAETLSKRVRPLLKEWVDKGRAVKVGGQVLDYRESKKKSFDDGRPVFDYLADLDFEPDALWKMFKPTMDDLKRVVKGVASKDEAKAIIEAIEAMQKTTTGTRFGFGRDE